MENSEIHPFSRLLRKERRELGLSQTELAELSGVGINLVSELERGRLSIRLDKLMGILNSLGLELRVRRGKEGVVVEGLNED